MLKHEPIVSPRTFELLERRELQLLRGHRDAAPQARTNTHAPSGNSSIGNWVTTLAFHRNGLQLEVSADQK